jgi:hypothetical protein
MQQRLNSAVSKPPKSQHPVRQMWQLQEPPDLHRNPALAGKNPTNNLVLSIFENGRRQHERRKENRMRKKYMCKFTYEGREISWFRFALNAQDARDKMADILNQEYSGYSDLSIELADH